MKTLIALLAVSVLINVGLATDYIRIGKPEETGYSQEQRDAMEMLAKELDK